MRILISIAFVTVGLFCSIPKIKAQSVQATYNTILSFGVGNSSGVQLKSKLEYNGHLSLFTYKNKQLEQEKEQLTKTIQEEGRFQIVHMPLDEIGELALIDHYIKGTIQRKILQKQAYIIQRDKDIPLWDIKKTSKKVGAYTCYKATTDFRGREYTAWYTPEIALPLGPWLLYGLPGMIVEAYDVNKEVHFQLLTVEQSKDEIIIPLKIVGDPISTEEFWGRYLEYEEMRERNGRLITESVGGSYEPLGYKSSIELYTDY